MHTLTASQLIPARTIHDLTKCLASLLVLEVGTQVTWANQAPKQLPPARDLCNLATIAL